jgi:hypothetical protein
MTQGSCSSAGDSSASSALRRVSWNPFSRFPESLAGRQLGPATVGSRAHVPPPLAFERRRERRTQQRSTRERGRVGSIGSNRF